MQNTKNRCTLKQLSEIVGVAPSTVSRVLNNRHSNVQFTEDTVKKIHEAVKKYGYTPNINARRLLRNQSFVIGLEVPSGHINGLTFADNTLTKTLSGIEEVIINSDYKLLILFKTRKYMETRENIQILREKAIDGLLVWGASYLDDYDQELLDYPVIFLNSRPGKLKNFNFVGGNNFQAGFDMAEYAIGRGCRRPLFFSGGNTNSINEDRCNGLTAALLKHQLEMPPENLITADYRYDLAAQAMEQILTEKKLQFDSIICSNDSMCEGVYHTALKHGLRIPDDFKLSGGDGDHNDYNNLGFTTFVVNSQEIGAIAARKLIDMVNGKGKDSFETILNAELIKRRTM